MINSYDCNENSQYSLFAINLNPLIYTKSEACFTSKCNSLDEVNRLKEQKCEFNKEIESYKKFLSVTDSLTQLDEFSPSKCSACNTCSLSYRGAIQYCSSQQNVCKVI